MITHYFATIKYTLRRELFMIKATRARHYLVLLMAFFLVLGQLNLTALKVFAKENGNDELTYEVQSKLAEDKKSADLTIKVTPKKRSGENPYH